MKWEYKAIEGTITIAELNEIGKEGWELIQVTGSLLTKVHMIFKRPLK